MAKRHLFGAIAGYCVDLVVGFGKVRAERDSDTLTAFEDHPPIYPGEYAEMRSIEFISNVLDPYREHLQKHWKL